MLFIKINNQKLKFLFSIHDDVVRWVKSVQKSVGRAGDLVLEELRSKTSAGTLGIKFIGNEEFLQSLTPDKIGFLQEEKKSSPCDVGLKDRLTMMGLAPQDSKVFIIKVFFNYDYG